MTEDKQKTFDYLKHGFTAEQVLVKITPVNKKSVVQMVQLYNVPVNQPGHKFVQVDETYRWGVGYKEGEDMDQSYIWRMDEHECDPTIGHGAELDDQISVYFEYDGEWTDAEKAEFEDRWENGDPDDNDGRRGMGWIYDYQDIWQIEDESLIIHGPFQYDVIGRDESDAKVYITDWQPPKTEDVAE